MKDNHHQSVNRRRLLRRAGTVAAGLAGTAAVGATAAAPAEAAVGDPVLQGKLNETGPGTTRISNSAGQATLQLTNTLTWPGQDWQDGLVLSEAPLCLLPKGDTLHEQMEPGSIGFTRRGELQVVGRNDGGSSAVVATVHTSVNANRIVPVVPQRLIDTRSAASRTRIVNPTDNLDSSGRLLAGHTIHIDLTDFVHFGDALFGNVTVTGPTAAGFVQIFPYGVSRPTTYASINFTANQTLSNSFMSGISFKGDRISVYAQRTTHVIIDVAAFVIGVGSVNPAVLPLPAGTAHTEQAVADLAAARSLEARWSRPSWR
ncbi:hypothetical protein ACFY3U_06850 [Micromonospora sp. NPDC000089]|uniref:hypothetical protein n=1 Tax=unclassified Micromonospora TaxID=2617518 RepID=UPI0036AE84A1